MARPPHRAFLTPRAHALRSTTDQRRVEMRRFFIALAALLTSTGIFSVATPASADSYPVCLACGSTDALRCDYATLEQCRATASGGLGYCVMNPAYTSNAYASYRGAGKRIIDRHRIW
jgi:hypothetical protein